MSNLGQGILFLEEDAEKITRAKHLWPACVVATTAPRCRELLASRSWTTLVIGEYPDEGNTVNAKDYGMGIVNDICLTMPRISEVVISSLNAPVAAQMQRELVKAGYATHLARFGESPIWKTK